MEALGVDPASTRSNCPLLPNRLRGSRERWGACLNTRRCYWRRKGRGEARWSVASPAKVEWRPKHVRPSHVCDGKLGTEERERRSVRDKARKTVADRERQRDINWSKETKRERLSDKNENRKKERKKWKDTEGDSQQDRSIKRERERINLKNK